MPLYDYKCAKCENVVEVRHGFDDVYAQPCPQCGGKLNRVFNPAPIVFKGSGFYVTDSRAKTEASAKKEPAKESTAKEPAKESTAKEPAAKESPKESKKSSDSKEPAA